MGINHLNKDAATGKVTWKQVQLLDIVKIVSGQIDPKQAPYSNMYLIAPDHIESGSGKITTKATAQSQGAISGKYYAKKGSVLYSKIRPYLCKAAIANEDVLCSADMYPMICNGSIMPEYLLQVLLSKHFTNFTTSMSGRTGIPKINREELAEYCFNLPNVETQQIIIAILNTWDTAITQAEQLITKKQKLKKGLMQQLLTGKKRLRGYVDPWHECKLKDLMVVRKERAIISESLPLYSLTIEDGVTPKTERYNRESLVKNKEEKTYKIVKKNDVVYNPSNLRWGAIGIHRMSGDVAVSPIYEVLHAKQSKADINFLYQILSSPRQISIFASRCEGTLTERMAVKIDAFLLTHISISADIHEQKEIATTLDNLDGETTYLKKISEQFKEQKRGLMQKLLTGKIRVKV